MLGALFGYMVCYLVDYFTWLLVVLVVLGYWLYDYVHMFRLKLGLEIHAQLNAGRKLFSPSIPSPHALPNTRVSFFDAALPGTQPILDWNCVHLGMRAALALNARVQPRFAFDRKHYFYPDQPSGYQITQKHFPLARNGVLPLLKRDGVQNALDVRIEQIQLEQDTGRTSYLDDLTLVDLNRANTGLIELVTKPDMRSAAEAVAFVKKLRLILKGAGVCTGEMEQGALRVDVNVSVMDDAGRDLSSRCEIKNLFGFAAIKHSIMAEFQRQCDLLARNEVVERDTRGWDGKNTYKLRSKEEAADYRYFPDPDLPDYVVPNRVIESVRNQMMPMPDTLLDKLTSKPFSLSNADAYTLVELDSGLHSRKPTEESSSSDSSLTAFCVTAVQEFLQRGGSEKNAKLIGKWLVNIWLGIRESAPQNTNQFVDLFLAVDSNEITTTTAKMLLKLLANGYQGSIADAVKEYDLDTSAHSVSELSAVCKQVLDENPSIVARIKSGKRNAIMVLVGLVLKETQGTFDPKLVREEIDRTIQ